MKKGVFIAIYGINNIGKSTQSKLLVDNLEKAGYKVKYLKYPIYDLPPTGPFLNSVLRGSEGQKISEDELQLWFILNRYQFEPELKKYLAEGYVVVAEDYVGTGIAWGTAKGLEQNWLEKANKFLLKEDLAILMEGERVMTSVEEVHVHEQNEMLLQKCADVFSKLADDYKWTKIRRREKMEETAEVIWGKVKGYLESCF